MKKVIQKIKNIFNQGLTPTDLALSIVIAVVISLFPVIGLTTVVISFLAISLKLNFPIMITIAYSMEPIKLFLIIPFIKLGAKIFNVQHELLTYGAIKKSFNINFWSTLKNLSYELVCGTTGWAVSIIPFGIILFFGLKKIFSSYQNSKEEHIAIQ